MGAKETVIKILRDPVLGRISFTLEGVRVVGREFSKLIVEINHSKLQVGIDPCIDTPANYEPVRHIIRLKNNSVGSDVGSRAAIAHECTHAYLSARTVSGLTNEVAGFLMEVLYALAKAPTRVRHAIQPNPFMPPAATGEKGIGQQALALIDKFEMHKRSCMLRRKDYEALGKAILSHPKYQHLKIR